MLLWTSLVCYNISVTQCVEIQCIWRAHHVFWLICIWCSQKPPCIGMFLHAHFIFQIKNQKRTSFDDLFQYSNKNDKLTRISAEASNLLLYFVILRIDTKIISKVVSFCLCTQQTNKANTVCVCTESFDVKLADIPSGSNWQYTSGVRVLLNLRLNLSNKKISGIFEWKKKTQSCLKLLF